MAIRFCRFFGKRSTTFNRHAKWIATGFLIHVIVILGTAAADSTVADSTAQLRTWTDRSGKKIEASLQEHVGAKVKLKSANGKTITVPFEDLGYDDRSYLAELRRSELQAVRSAVATAPGSDRRVVLLLPKSVNVNEGVLLLRLTLALNANLVEQAIKDKERQELEKKLEERKSKEEAKKREAETEVADQEKELHELEAKDELTREERTRKVRLEMRLQTAELRKELESNRERRRSRRDEARIGKEQPPTTGTTTIALAHGNDFEPGNEPLPEVLVKFVSVKSKTKNGTAQGLNERRRPVTLRYHELTADISYEIQGLDKATGKLVTRMKGTIQKTVSPAATDVRDRSWGDGYGGVTHYDKHGQQIFSSGGRATETTTTIVKKSDAELRTDAIEQAAVQILDDIGYADARAYFNTIRNAASKLAP